MMVRPAWLLRECAWVGLLLLGSACVEPGGAPDKSVSYSGPARAFNRGDYDSAGAASPLAAAGNGPRGTAGMSGTTTPTPGTASAGKSAPAPTSAAGRGGAAGTTPSLPTAGATGTTGMPVTPPPTTPSSGPATGMLSVMFTSVDMRGRYSPRNCGAVWIESGKGEFVKTIERWCGIRAYYLKRWTTASGGWGGRGTTGTTTMKPDQMDAISSATLRSHVAHKPTWAAKDVNGKVVADGDYKLVIEVSDGEAKSVEVPFKKGAEAAHAMPPDQTPLTGLIVDYQPGPSP